MFSLCQFWDLQVFTTAANFGILELGWLLDDLAAVHISLANVFEGVCKFNKEKKAISFTIYYLFIFILGICCAPPLAA